MTENATAVEDEVVSDARVARKEAQVLVNKLGRLLRGKSGLDREAKIARLVEAHKVVQDAQAAIQRALASV